jgi:hypothetical protein
MHLTTRLVVVSTNNVNIGVLAIIVVVVIPAYNIIVFVVGMNPPTIGVLRLEGFFLQQLCRLKRSSPQSMPQSLKDFAHGNCTGIKGSHPRLMP